MTLNIRVNYIISHSFYISSYIIFLINIIYKLKHWLIYSYNFLFVIKVVLFLLILWGAGLQYREDYLEIKFSFFNIANFKTPLWKWFFSTITICFIDVLLFFSLLCKVIYCFKDCFKLKSLEKFWLSPLIKF